MEAWQMTRFVDTQLAKIPMEGPGVPAGNYNLPTTNWMPYRWSINNVTLGESAHTTLACWQAGRPELALPLFKGALLDAMFLGHCPGNVGMTAPSDVFSGEQYRDFADAVGITARAFVEGFSASSRTNSAVNCGSARASRRIGITPASAMPISISPSSARGCGNRIPSNPGCRNP